MTIRSLIIVPVDDAPETEATLTYAMAVAEQRGAALHAVQVVQRDGGLWAAPQREVRLRTRLRALRASMADAGGTFRMVTLRGAPVEALTAYARAESATTIVVGSHYGTARRWRTTAIAARLARVAPVPVVVVPRAVAPSARPAPRRIVVAVDESLASVPALRHAAHLAHTHDAQVTIVQSLHSAPGLIFTGGEAWRFMDRFAALADATAERLKRRARGVGLLTVDPVVVSRDPHRAIIDAAGTHAADLIVMGAAPRSWFDQLTLGSTLRAVLRRASVPVVVLPATAEAPARLRHLQGVVGRLEVSRVRELS